MPFNIAMPSNIAPRYLALGLFAVWLGILLLFGLIHSDVFGLEESAAKNLILIWSVVDQIASPVGVYSTPDLRAFLFIPVGLYWPGSLFAAKIFTAGISFLAVLCLYRLGRRQDNEAAIISAVLLLVSPIVITQIDAIGSGPYLLLCFGLAQIVDQRYRGSGNHLGGWYFTQILLIALAVSLHPMGLAYPIALMWAWWKEQENLVARKSVLISTVITTILIAAFSLGWPDMQGWFANPFQVLSDAAANGLSGLGGRANIGIGIFLFGILAYLLFKDWKNTLSTFTGRVLLISSIGGIVSADATWALLTLSLILIRGIPLLIRISDSFAARNFLGQRGLVLVSIVLISMMFMLSNKTYVQQKELELVAPVDSVIRAICAEAIDPDKPFKAASQWPARTLIACRRDVFPLPPAAPTGEELLTRIKGITHLAFDHTMEKNQGLVDNMSDLSGATETLSLQNAGVVVHIKPTTSPEDQ